ncbi:unnamed protein product, partial [Brassica oleracea var. botrytis]
LVLRPDKLRQKTKHQTRCLNKLFPGDHTNQPAKSSTSKHYNNHPPLFHTKQVFIRYWSTAWSSQRHLGVFGAQKRCKGDHWTSRALGATLPERHRQVALTCLIRATLPERRGEVARVFIARRHENGPGATSRSDPSRSLPKPGATSRSDYWRSLRASCLLEFMFTQGPFGHFIMHVFTF